MGFYVYGGMQRLYFTFDVCGEVDFLGGLTFSGKQNKRERGQIKEIVYTWLPPWKMMVMKCVDL